MADTVENKAEQITNNIGSDNDIAAKLFDDAFSDMSNEDFAGLAQKVKDQTSGDSNGDNDVYFKKDEFGQVQSVYVNDGYVSDTKLFDANTSKHKKSSDGEYLYDHFLSKENPNADDLKQIAAHLDKLAKKDPDKFVRTVKDLKQKTEADWKGSGNDIQVEVDGKGKVVNVSINDGVWSDTLLYSTKKSLTDVYNGIKQGYNALNDALAPKPKKNK